MNREDMSREGGDVKSGDDHRDPDQRNEENALEPLSAEEANKSCERQERYWADGKHSGGQILRGGGPIPIASEIVKARKESIQAIERISGKRTDERPLLWEERIVFVALQDELVKSQIVVRGEHGQKQEHDEQRSDPEGGEPLGASERGRLVNRDQVQCDRRNEKHVLQFDE